MNFTVAYKGRSGLTSGPGGMALSFAPNLRRDRVSFVGDLREPLRFREAASALHAIVVGDLRIKPKDRDAYRTYKQRVLEREAAIRRQVFETTRDELRTHKIEPMPAGLEQRFRTMRKSYWDARDKYGSFLWRDDRSWWWRLVASDPVVTVAPDALFFECFSKDESSYGCLTIDRNAFEAQGDVALGTTNVDYSLALYEEFQRLRSYRRTRFAVDPLGFEVRTEGAADYREEKIDLPPSWLQGFMQLQAAMSMPARKVPVSRDGLYNLLAYLKRHKARTSPRAVRFELTPGQPVQIVIEPWEARIKLHDIPFTGPVTETVRVWGRDRLLALSRLLPLADGADVYLMGTGLPSYWSVRMGEMRLLLGLSGWTANDWTSGGGALADLAPPAEPSEDLLGDIATAFEHSPTLTFEQVRQRTGAAAHFVAAGLNRFALLGQVIHDLVGGVYRWRQIMPIDLSLNQVRVESPEAEAGRVLARHGRVKVARDEKVGGLRVIVGKAEGRDCELVLDADGRGIKGNCSCSHYFRFKLRAGPCRHMQALRRIADGEKPMGSLEHWFSRFAGTT